MAIAEPVTRRDRWLALGLLLAVLALAYLLFVHLWWTLPMQQQQQRIDALRERELRVRTQLQQAPQVATRLAKFQTTQASKPGFLSEATSELATAGLVQRLQAVVVQASPGNIACRISNRAPISDANQAEKYTRVTVQVRMLCGSSELAAVLHALESGRPRLFVDNLNVMTSNRTYLGAGQGAGGLNVSFDLYGYLRPVATPVAAAGAVRTRNDASGEPNRAR